MALATGSITGGETMRQESLLRIRDKAGAGYAGNLDEVILEIGGDIFTRQEIALLGCPNLSAVGRLNRAIRQIETSKRFRASDALGLAERMSLDDLWQIDGVGERTIAAWLYILESSGIDSTEWVNDERKLSTLCARKRPIDITDRKPRRRRKP